MSTGDTLLMGSPVERQRRTQEIIDAVVAENADAWAAKLGCSREEVIAAAPRADLSTPTRAEIWAAATGTP